MLVAVAILGLSLGAMYNVVGGATRTVGVDEKMVYGVELARSLLVSYAVVPPGGLSDEGETEGGFNWEVQAQPLELPEDGPLDEGQLQLIQVAVRWSDGDRERQFKLHSVVAGLETEEDE